MNDSEPYIARAAHAILNCGALLIGAGAGASVDSGLPDFRGAQGFWTAYPPFRGRPYTEIISPQTMEQDPAQAWGFYGHCLQLYRTTKPHEGFEIVRNWTKRISEYFVFTSNIDGHFQRTGFAHDRIVEVHGSIHFMQCSRGLNCSKTIWSSDDTTVEVDEASLKATGRLPECAECRSLARPNILLFGDRAWNPLRFAEQDDRYKQWCNKVRGSNVVAIEIGAGTAVPTVRYECQRKSRKLIRINPHEFEANVQSISIPMGGLEAVRKIDSAMMCSKR